MSHATSPHLGYTLVPRWIRGLPGRFFALSVSRSGVMHAWSTPNGEIVTRCERLGFTVKVWDWVGAIYFDSRPMLVSRFETALALAVDGGHVESPEAVEPPDPILGRTP